MGVAMGARAPQQLAMHVDHVACSTRFVKMVDVLRDDVK